MDLGLTEEQEMLRQFARDFLEKECPEQHVRDMEEDDARNTVTIYPAKGTSLSLRQGNDAKYEGQV